MSLPGKGASHANCYLEILCSSPSLQLAYLYFHSVWQSWDQEKKGRTETTGMQVQLQVGLRTWDRWHTYSIWGALLPLLVKFLAKMLASVGVTWDQDLRKCWSVDPHFELLCVVSWLLTSPCRGRLGACKINCSCFPVSQRWCCCLAARGSSEEGIFLLVVDRKKTPPKQMSHKTESLALCTPAHLLNNILTPCLCFLFFRCRLGEDIWCR